MSMPKHGPPFLALTEVRMIRMNSKAEPDDVWQLTVEGYMVGLPVPLEQAKALRAWLTEGALRDITNLLRR